MNRQQDVKNLAVAGLLTALGILIPLMMPIKLVIPPAFSYTLASHVPIFIAMFVSPWVAIMVTLGTALGFALNGLPIMIAARALSHLSFVIPGSLYIKKHRLDTPVKKIMFNFIIALIHGLFEFGVVALISSKDLNFAIIMQFFLFLGIGTIIHSMVDFILALIVVDGLKLQEA